MKTIARLLLIARHAAARSLRGRRAVALVLLASIAPLMTYLFARSGAVRPIEAHEHALILVLIVLYQFIVPFTALFLGTSIMGDEIEGRTITYLFTRPVPRGGFYVARLLGTVGGYGAVLAIAMSLAFWAIADVLRLDAAAIARSVGIGLLGFFAYSAVFALLRTLVRHALFVGFVLAFIFEGVVSKLPRAELSSWSVWHHLAVLQVRVAAIEPGHIDVLQGIAADETASRSAWTLLAIFGVATLAGAWVVHTREVRLPAAVG